MSEKPPSGSVVPERIRDSNVRLQVGMRMNRWLVSGLALVSLFFALVSLSFLGLTPLREVASEQAVIQSLFSSFIGAIITGTAIVVTINQLVLSQELGSAGDQYDRMRDSMAFRRDVESVLDGGVSPPEPASFLYALLDAIESRAEELKGTTGDTDGGRPRELEAYADAVIDDTRAVKNSLNDAQFGTFEVISNAIGYDYSSKIHRGRQLRHEHAASMSDETDAILDDLIESLTLFGPSREHIKTLYFQWELIDLSRALLYIAVPALVVMTGFVMFVDGTTVPGHTFGVDNLVWLIGFGFTVGVAPFVVFSVFIVRIITVAKHTLAMEPIVLRESEQREAFDRNEP